MGISISIFSHLIHRSFLIFFDHKHGPSHQTRLQRAENPSIDMAPAVKGRAKAKSSSSTTKAANLKKPSAPTKTPSAISKVRKQKATVSKQTQVKTKRLSAKDALNKKKKRVYTAEELGVPQLNGIVPIGVEKPKGKKKGKVFVDDADSMMTILKIVEADKKGQIESKILRERQLEEVREARRKEQEGRYEEKKAKLVSFSGRCVILRLDLALTISCRRRRKILCASAESGKLTMPRSRMPRQRLTSERQSLQRLARPRRGFLLVEQRALSPVVGVYIGSLHLLVVRAS